MSEPARYVNGEPENLTAAAWDALAWLERMPRPDDPENLRRLERCIAALREELAPCIPPQMPAEHYTSSYGVPTGRDAPRQGVPDPDPAPAETPGLANTGEDAEGSGAGNEALAVRMYQRGVRPEAIADLTGIDPARVAEMFPGTSTEGGRPR